MNYEDAVREGPAAYARAVEAAKNCAHCGKPFRPWQLWHYIAVGVVVHDHCLRAYARALYASIMKIKGV